MFISDDSTAHDLHPMPKFSANIGGREAETKNLVVVGINIQSVM